MAEVQTLDRWQCAVIYHQNTRRRSGHDAEVDHWLGKIGVPGIAVRGTACSPTTFFVLNPDGEMEERVLGIWKRWAGMKVMLHGAR